MSRVAVAWVLVAAFACADAAGAAVPTPVVETGFMTPSRNIDCNAGPYRGRPLLACTVFSEESSTRGQKVWAIAVTGRAAVGYVLGNAATDLPFLAYGHAWSYRGIRCSSRARGLTCTNRSGHGFFLSRAEQRVF
jgi:hypothetical protein